MNKKQSSLLLNLAKRLKKEDSSKESAIKSLSSAGIVTREGKISKSYPNLERILSVTE